MHSNTERVNSMTTSGSISGKPARSWGALGVTRMGQKGIHTDTERQEHSVRVTKDYAV